MPVPPLLPSGTKVVSCGAAVSACDKAGQWPWALQMLETGKSSGISLNSAMARSGAQTGIAVASVNIWLWLKP